MTLAVLVLASTPGIAALWTPVHTSTALWLDADETSAVQTSGGRVTSWLDQSGNGRHVQQASTSRQPTNGTRTINGLNAIDFRDDALQTAAIATWLNSTSFHFVAVLQHDAAGYYAGTDSPEGGNKVLHMGQSGSNWRHAHFSNDASWSHPLDTNALIAVNSFKNTGSEAFINGTLLGSSGAPSSALATLGPLSIGTPVGIFAGGNLGFYDGTMGEIVCVLGELSTTDRQLLEGYAAHKWGLAGRLPGDHPYKDAPPTVPNEGTVLMVR